MARKSPRGVHTGPNVWDEARRLEIRRGGELLDPGVNFFVLMLDQMGLPTHYSCEGHPGGFYVTFNAPYDTALAIKEVGYFSVEIEQELYWSLRTHVRHDAKEKLDAMRWSAAAWEKAFGPLDFERVALESRWPRR